MQFDREKLQEIVLHIVSACGPEELGAVTLHKVLYFADMLTFVNAGRPLTGATYRKRPYGPTCEQLYLILGDLEKTGRLAVREQPEFGFQKMVLHASAKADLSRFSPQEILIVDEVIGLVCRENPARSMSEVSRSPAWALVDYGECLTYESALLIGVEPVSAQAMQAVAERMGEIEAARSQQNPVDLKAFRTLRERLLEAGGAVR